MNDQADREDIAYYNFVAAFRQEHKRFPRPEEAWKARAALDTAPERKVGERDKLAEALFYRADGQGQARWATEPEFNKEYWRKLADTAVAALRTTKPADDGQLVAFAEWLSGRSPETFWVTAVDEGAPSYMDAKESVTWFLQQQKGERRE